MEETSRRNFFVQGATGFAGLTIASLLRQNDAVAGTASPYNGPTMEDRVVMAEAAVAAVYDELGSQLDAIYNDPQFQPAFEAFDIEGFSDAFNRFTEAVTAYNLFHRRERRLWSVKAARGELRYDQGDSFLASIPEGRQAYLDAFAEVDRMAVMIGRSGLDKTLETHLASLTAVFANDKHPFSQMVLGYFRQVGCAQPMIDEFRAAFAPINYDFLGAIGGFEALQALTKAGVEAQLTVLDYTQNNGLTYLRGRCGPPAWAVVASEILAAAGISISAWAIVAIIGALLAILVAICVASPKGSWLRKKCEKLEVLLPAFSF